MKMFIYPTEKRIFYGVCRQLGDIHILTFRCLLMDFYEISI